LEPNRQHNLCRFFEPAQNLKTTAFRPVVTITANYATVLVDSYGLARHAGQRLMLDAYPEVGGKIKGYS
jgi:hypothetical protein